MLIGRGRGVGYNRETSEKIKQVAAVRFTQDVHFEEQSDDDESKRLSSLTLVANHTVAAVEKPSGQNSRKVHTVGRLADWLANSCDVTKIYDLPDSRL